MGMHVCQYSDTLFLAYRGQFGRKFSSELGRPLSIDWSWEISATVIIFQYRFFGPLLMRKWAWPPRTSHAPNSTGPPNPKKSWFSGCNFWVNCDIKIMFSKSSGVNSTQHLEASLKNYFWTNITHIPNLPSSSSSSSSSDSSSSSSIGSGEARGSDHSWVSWGGG